MVPQQTVLWIDENPPEHELRSKLGAIAASGWRVLFYPSAYEALRQWAQIAELAVHMRCLLVATPRLCDSVRIDRALMRAPTAPHARVYARACAHTHTYCTKRAQARPLECECENFGVFVGFQPESSLILLNKLAGQYSELVMFTHSAGRAVLPLTSQRLRELAMRANIVHEHLDVQSPTQIIDIIQAASPVLCAPPPPEAAVRCFAPVFSVAPPR